MPGPLKGVACGAPHPCLLHSQGLNWSNPRPLVRVEGSALWIYLTTPLGGVHMQIMNQKIKLYIILKKYHNNYELWGLNMKIVNMISYGNMNAQELILRIKPTKRYDND